MAVIHQPEANGFDTGALAPSGTYVATCLDVQDQFGVDRPKFENPQETEKLDVTRFLFGFRGADGRAYKVQSFEFRISGSPKSNLFKFLTTWLGTPPKYGWDYCELKGQGAMITVAQKQSRDGTKTYANIVGIAPVIDQLRSQVLPLQAFGPNEEGRGQNAEVTQRAPSAMPALQQPAAPAPSPWPQHPVAPPPAPPNPQAPATAFPPAPPIQPWNPAVDPQENCPF